jgi:hypothetical protein
VGVSVKVAGHSYFGASTVNNSLLIKMTSYPKYAITGGPMECANETDYTTPVVAATEESSATAMACKLAKARGKNAILRVGGGEMFDEAYRSVSFDWNLNENNTNKYHLVGGGAGTVSAAGGWLASGGLSGTTGMRMYGIGIDQVLHMEMILPNGTHVRFGPSQWEDAEGYVYPKTTEVTGYCNSMPLEDEAQWDWQPCDGINFDDLWFAARGGGGGSFGIVTSVYYQIHDQPGPLQQVYAQIPLPETTTDTQYFVLAMVYVEFVLKFFYMPEALGVAEEHSDYCGSAMSASFDPYSNANFFSATMIRVKFSFPNGQSLSPTRLRPTHF